MMELQIQWKSKDGMQKRFKTLQTLNTEGESDFAGAPERLGVAHPWVTAVELQETLVNVQLPQSML